MYGVLMLLPQSGEAFRTLHTRLQCAPTMALLALGDQEGGDRGGGGQQQQQHAQKRPGGAKQPGVDEHALLQLFVQRQERVCRVTDGG